jgi:hypothetical protein
MTDKLWFRKSDGALVRPTMKPSNATFRAASWQNHIASLPALTDVVIDPEYAKTLGEGWAKVERVRYEQECFDKWEKITKEDFYNTPYNRRLVILAPVEKGEEKNLFDMSNPVRQFMLKKFPTNEYMDCPVPQHHWETIQEYASQCTAPLEARIRELEYLLRFSSSDGWIDCKEDKPKMFGKYMVHTKRGCNILYFGVSPEEAYYEDRFPEMATNFWRYGRDDEAEEIVLFNDEVTHWRELPKPPNTI